MQTRSPESTEATPDTRGATARALTARGALLLDVRTQEEFHTGHVEGALNIPLHELARRSDELGPKQHPVVVYCRSGRRSAEAAQLLRGQGFAHVHDMGAMFEWAGVARAS